MLAFPSSQVSEEVNALESQAWLCCREKVALSNSRSFTLSSCPLRVHDKLKGGVLQIKKADRKITDTQMAAQEALATPGFQQLASHLVESCHELNRRRKECLGSLAEPSEDSPMTGKEGYEHEAEAS